MATATTQEITELLRAWGRGDKRKESVAVRRRHRYPPATVFKASISDQIESKLIHIELHAAIMIANENSGAEHAQIRGMAIEA